MAFVNLNIDDYINEELVELLDLPCGFTFKDIEFSKTNLEQQLINNSDMNSEQKRNIIFFLDNVGNRLKNNITSIESLSSTKQEKESDNNSGTWAGSVQVEEYGSNILIRNPNEIAGKHAKIVDGRLAESGKAPPGYINPVNIRTTMQGITIDSRFRKNYYNTNASHFSVNLPHTQRNVLSMRVATIELPLTYHSISKSQGNNTFIIHCNYHGDKLEGSPCQILGGEDGDSSGFVDISPGNILDNSYPQYNYNFKWLPKDHSTENTNITSPFTTTGGCVRMHPVIKNKLNSNFTNKNPWPIGSSKELEFYGNKSVGLPGDKIPAWLVTIPDGNYEQRWMGAAKTENIETIINNAIVSSKPGYLIYESDKSKFSKFVPYSDTDKLALSHLDPKQDICFTIDRTSGRGVFAAPSPISNKVQSRFINHGFALRFIVDTEGNLDIDTNIQLRLGWQLGFRAASYWCGGRSYASVNADPSTVGSAISEGITLITGPRYCFLSINDHKTSTGPTMIASYANSTLDNNIIARINLASTMASTHAYQYSDDPGHSTQLHRQREYFGPVDINRLDITLYDEYGRILDLNNMDWSFTLAFEKQYS